MVGVFTDRIERNQGLDALGVQAVPATTGEVLGATWEETLIRNPTATISRGLDRFDGVEQAAILDAMNTDPISRDLFSGARAVEFGRQNQPRLMDSDEANDRFGIPGHLTFNRPVSERVAESLQNLKQEELRREEIFRRAQGGFKEWSARLAVGLAGSVLDPLNVASAFIPAVGPTRYATWLEGATSAAARAGIRARVGAVEGAIGALAVEPIVYLGAKSEQADYGAADSLLNIAFGTVLGGGLHASAGAIGDRITGRFSKAIENAPSEFKEASLRSAVAQVAEGRPVRIDPLLDIEKAQLGDAYDSVRLNPIGPPDDPVVRIRPSDIDEILIQRGNAIERGGEIVVQGRGFGLVKFIFKHGEESNLAPDARITKEDVVAFPEVIRNFEPAETKGSPGQEGYRRAWRVERDGRTIVYAATRWNEADRAVTMYVEKKGGPTGPMSRELPPESRTGIMSPNADTAGGLPSQLDRSRAATPSIGAQTANGNAVKQAVDISSKPETRSLDGVDDLSVSRTLPGTKPADAAQEADQLLSEVSERAKAIQLDEAEQGYLNEADLMAKKAEARGRVAEIGAACMGS